MIDVFKIESRVAALIEQHQELKLKSLAQEKTINQLSRKNEQLAEDLSTLKEKYKALQISRAFMSQEQDSEQAKKAIREVLREVDKCIALLGNE